MTKPDRPAAAPEPDLLAAAKALIEAYRRGEESHQIDWNDVDRAYALALKAVAKVEGKT